MEKKASFTGSPSPSSPSPAGNLVGIPLSSPQTNPPTQTSFSTSSHDLNSLSSRAGVDFVALRDKYKAIQSSTVPPASTSSYDKSIGASKAALDLDAKLSKYKICDICNGAGVLKEIYNKSMVMEKTCTNCDGESLIAKEFMNNEMERMIREDMAP